jgi:8-oxo-dGTP diphosphatase
VSDPLQVAAAAVVGPDGRVLIARRPAAVHQGGLWEFPGGKLEPGETAEQALSRELWEELGIRPTRYRPLIRIPHRYPDRSVLLDVWRVDAFTGSPAGRQGQPLRWVEPDALPGYAFPAANRPIVAAARLPDRYLITPDCDHQASFLESLKAAVGRGCRLVQLRAPALAPDAFETLARAAIAVCHALGARILLNAAPEVAVGLGADGVHLSAHQLRTLAARPVGEQIWCAASCHDQEELARAQAIGVDFAVLSPVRPTATHPDARPLGWPGFKRLVAAAPFPVYALGGVGPADLPQAFAARAQGVAAIRSLWSPFYPWKPSFSSLADRP